MEFFTSSMKRKTSSLKVNLLKERFIHSIAILFPFLNKSSRNQLQQFTHYQDIDDQLKTNKPLSLIQFSDIELQFLYDHLWIVSGLSKKIKPELKSGLISQQFLPMNEKNLKFLIKQYTKEATKFDFYLHQKRGHENFILDTLFPEVKVIKAVDKDKLIDYAKTKKVLFVSNQFTSFETLSASLDISPIKSNLKQVQFLNTDVEKVDDDVWFDKLDKLKVEIMKHDFQLLILDSGLFNTHLALFAKSMSKQAIVIPLKVLFEA